MKKEEHTLVNSFKTGNYPSNPPVRFKAVQSPQNQLEHKERSEGHLAEYQRSCLEVELVYK